MSSGLVMRSAIICSKPLLFSTSRTLATIVYPILLNLKTRLGLDKISLLEAISFTISSRLENFLGLLMSFKEPIDGPSIPVKCVRQSLMVIYPLEYFENMGRNLLTLSSSERLPSST